MCPMDDLAASASWILPQNNQQTCSGLWVLTPLMGMWCGERSLLHHIGGKDADRVGPLQGRLPPPLRRKPEG